MIYPIDKSKTVLLIIDAQQEYSTLDRPLFVADFDETVNQINLISHECREAGIPVILIKHIHAKSGLDVGRMGDFSPDEVFTEGSEFAKLATSLVINESDITIEKTRYSSFINTSLESFLKTLGADTLLVTGFMTGYCSVTTARHAHDLDYKVIYVNDANSGPVFGDLGFGDVTLEEIKRVTATLLAGGVAEVINAADVISRLK
jgi:nicotinamidase-related amidase